MKQLDYSNVATIVETCIDQHHQVAALPCYYFTQTPDLCIEVVSFWKVTTDSPIPISTMASFGSPQLATQSGKKIDPNDCVVPSPGSDGISSLNWSSKANILVSSNWDSTVSCWEIQQQSSTLCAATPKAQGKMDALRSVYFSRSSFAVKHDGGSPALDTCFSPDGNTVFTCGVDKAVRMWQLGSTPSGTVHQQIGAHDAPVKAVRFLEKSNLVVSGGWDRKLKFWDTRSPNPAGVIDLSERVYAMDARSDLLVVGTADRQIYSYDVSGPTPMEHSRKESPLKFMTRCISVFPDQSGFAVGSIEGRVGIHYVRNVAGKDSFAFKCHRQENNVYSVNGCAFNNQFGTFATYGSDGVVTFWDKDNKQRLKAFPALGRTISCASFNQQGNLFAYASSYDWSMGSMQVQPGNEIFVHIVQEQEVKPKAKKTSTGYKR